jgi:hypothetical protein
MGGTPGLRHGAILCEALSRGLGSGMAVRLAWEVPRGWRWPERSFAAFGAQERMPFTFHGLTLMATVTAGPPGLEVREHEPGLGVLSPALF